MKKLALLTALAAVIALSACKDDPGTGPGKEPEKGPVTAKFTTNIAPMATRVANDQFQANDRIGIFMTRTGTELEPGSALEDNVSATFGMGQNLTLAQQILYPALHNVDFVAYYPYSRETTIEYSEVEYNSENNAEIRTVVSLHALSIDVSDQQDVKEVLYSNNATNRSATEDAVQLNFKYSLAKLKVVITDASGEGNITANHFANMSATVNNVNIYGMLNLATGDFLNESYFGLEQGEIALCKASSSATQAVFEALIIPGESQSRTFSFNINGVTYRKELTGVYKAGIEYTLPFALNIGTPPEVTYLAAQASITARTPDTSTPSQTITDANIDNRILVTGIGIRYTDIVAQVGESYSIPVTVMPADATYPELNIKNYNPEIATADYDGKVLRVEGLALGETTIVLTAQNGTPDNPNDDLEVVLRVLVHSPYGEFVPVMSISINEILEIPAGSSFAPAMMVYPENATYRDLEVAVVNPSIAEVTNSSDGGIVFRGLMPGSTTVNIIAKNGTEDSSDDVYASCQIVVR